MGQYIYVGFSKCGTKTFAEVFRTLGFKVCDFEESMLDCGEMWNEYYNNNTTEARRIECLKEGFQNFDICLDAPCYLNWKELMINQLDQNRNVGIGKLPDWCLNFLGYTGFFPIERYHMAFVMKACFPGFLC